MSRRSRWIIACVGGLLVAVALSRCRVLNGRVAMYDLMHGDAAVPVTRLRIVEHFRTHTNEQETTDPAVLNDFSQCVRRCEVNPDNTIDHQFFVTVWFSGIAQYTCCATMSAAGDQLAFEWNPPSFGDPDYYRCSVPLDGPLNAFLLRAMQEKRGAD